MPSAVMCLPEPTGEGTPVSRFGGEGTSPWPAEGLVPERNHPDGVGAQVWMLPDGSEVDTRDLMSAVTAAFTSVLRSVTEPFAGDIEMLTGIGSALARTGSPMEPVLALLSQQVNWAVAQALRTGDVARPESAIVKNVLNLGNKMTRGLLNGFHHQLTAAVQVMPALTGERLASALLAGTQSAGAAAAYAVFAVHAGNGDLKRVWAELRAGQPGGPLAVLTGHGGYLLMPENGVARTRELATRLHAAVPDSLWIGYAWANTADVPAAAEKAADIVSMAVASRAPAGVYGLEDFLIEYAVLHHPSILAELQRLIVPVVANPVLLETLLAFLEADGNRTRAAKALIVHRSTLDYRLGRIEQLTGYAPTKPRGMQVLAVALTTSVAVTERVGLPSVAAQV